MSTKQQEREALKKICEIVDALGPDSYIATAFEGCFEDAQENIENDWACSMKGRVDDLDQENTRLKERVKELEVKLAESDKDYEAAHEAAIALTRERDDEISELKKKCEELGEAYKDMNRKRAEDSKIAEENMRRAKKAEDEVIRLKAMLFDYMVKEREAKQDA
mgnify:CR=1 FL=1